MNYGVMIDRVASYLDRTDLGDSTAASLSATKIGGWINDTIKDIALKYNFNYLYVEATINTSAGSSTYGLPDDYMGHLDMFLGTKKLVRIDPREFDSVHGDDMQIGDTDPANPLLFTTGSLEQDEPDYYIDRGMAFELWPHPDGTYQVMMRYYAQPTDVSQTTDENFIMRFHPETVIFGAVMRGSLFLDDTAKVQQFAPAYVASLQEIVNKEKEKKRTDLVVRFKTAKDFSVEQMKRIMKVNN
jgi:hypothetical protein